MITKTEFKKRQQKIFELFKEESGLIVLQSPTPQKKRGDQKNHFTQDNNIIYLTGITIPNTTVVFNLKTKQVTLFSPKPTLLTEIWTGKQPDFAKLKTQYHVDSVKDISELDKVLKKHKSIHSIDNCKPTKTKYKSTQLQKALFQMRITKSKAEIRRIKIASTHTKEMYKIVKKSLKKKQSPLVIKANIDHYITINQLEHAFDPIITTNGAVLHNDVYEPEFEQDKLLLVDFGAEYKKYASDFTRTVPTTKPTTFQRYILDAVRRIKLTTMDFVKPGVLLKDVHEFTVDLIITELLDLHLLKGSKEDIKKSEAYKVFFPHSIGHHLGLDTHDLSDLIVKKQKPTPLAENMVITIEPGIYFIDTYLKKMDEFSEYKPHINMRMFKEYAKEVSGVRDEDTILVTKSGRVSFFEL